MNWWTIHWCIPDRNSDFITLSVLSYTEICFLTGHSHASQEVGWMMYTNNAHLPTLSSLHTFTDAVMTQEERTKGTAFKVASQKPQDTSGNRQFLHQWMYLSQASSYLNISSRWISPRPLCTCWEMSMQWTLLWLILFSVKSHACDASSHLFLVMNELLEHLGYVNIILLSESIFHKVRNPALRQWKC